MAYPYEAEDFAWLRKQGIQLIISLTEEPPRRDWINDAGLMSVHVPVPDMTAPTVRQLEHLIDTIEKANQAGFGVAVHCAAGRGRTGTVLAAYLIKLGATPEQALEQVREKRPGSVETPEQERSLMEYFRTLQRPAQSE